MQPPLLCLLIGQPYQCGRHLCMVPKEETGRTVQRHTSPTRVRKGTERVFLGCVFDAACSHSENSDTAHRMTDNAKRQQLRNNTKKKQTADDGGRLMAPEAATKWFLG